MASAKRGERFKRLDRRNKMAVYEKWQSERYSIGCKVWEARCPNCHELVESADPISSNYRFCPYCGFDMKSDFQRVADRRQFTECLMKLTEAKRLLKAAVEDFAVYGALKDLSSEQRVQNPDWRRFNRVFDILDHQWRYTDEALNLLGKDETNEYN